MQTRHKQRNLLFTKRNGLTRFEKLSIAICGLCLGGMLIGRFTGMFRYSDYRIAYHCGWVSSYLIVFSSFLWGIVNASFLLDDKKNTLGRRVFWALVSLLPILYFLLMITISIIRNV
jgi:hypothetical protein